MPRLGVGYFPAAASNRPKVLWQACSHFCRQRGGNCPRSLRVAYFPLWYPPWRQPRGKDMVSSVNYHLNATSRRQHLWEIDLGFSPGLPPGWGHEDITSEGKHARPPSSESGGRCRATSLGGVPRRQKMLNGHLPRVVYHQVY